MSERDDRPVAEATTEGQQAHLDRDLQEGAGPGDVGALDGPAAAGSLGAVSGKPKDSLIPEGPPDRTIGPD